MSAGPRSKDATLSVPELVDWEADLLRARTGGTNEIDIDLRVCSDGVSAMSSASLQADQTVCDIGKRVWSALKGVEPPRDGTRRRALVVPVHRNRHHGVTREVSAICAACWNSVNASRSRPWRRSSLPFLSRDSMSCAAPATGSMSAAIANASNARCRAGAAPPSGFPCL